GQTRAAGWAELIGVELEEIAEVAGMLEDTACLRDGECGPLTENVTEAGLSGEGRQHLFADQINIALTPTRGVTQLGWEHVCAQKGGHDAWQTRLTSESCHSVQAACFGSDVETIASLALDRGCALGGKAAQALAAQGYQVTSVRGTGGTYS